MLNRSYFKVIALLSAVFTLFAGLNFVPGKASAATGESASSAVYRDGTYLIDYTVYKVEDGQGTNSASVMDGYMDKAAKAKVEIANGETWVTVVLTQAHWWVTLEVDNGDPKGAEDYKYPKVTTVSEDTAADKRTVKFKVADLGARSKSYVHVDATDTIPGYNNKYDIEFGFNTASIPLAGSEEPEQPGQPVEEPTLADGNYTIDFTVLKAEEDTPSTMERYFLAPKLLTVKDGKKRIAMTVADSSVVKEFKVAADGENYAEATTLSADEKADTRIVQFEVAQLKDILKAKVHVVTTYLNNGVPTPYEATYDIRFAFDIGSIKQGLANGKYNVSLTLPDNAKEHVDGTLGLTVEDAKGTVTFNVAEGATVTKLQKTGVSSFVYPKASEVAALALTAAKAVQFELYDLSATYTAFVKVDGDETERTFEFALGGATPAEEDGTGGNGGGTGGYLLSDGNYTMDFTVLKKGTTDTSVMNGYVVTTAKLRVENKINYVAVTLKQSKEITGFTVNGVTPNTIESNAAENTRTVEFEVADLTAIIPAWVKIDWPEYNYHHEYDIDLKFGAPRLVPVKIEAGPKEEETEESGGENAGSGTETGSAGETVRLSDIQYHWAKGTIEEAVKLGFVTGFTDGTFRPDAQVSRAEFTALIARALKLASAENGLTFKDLGNIPLWVRPYIAQAVEAGLVSGYQDNTFRSSNPITRTEIAVILIRALGIEPDETAELPFKDADQVQFWARPYVATAYKLGLIGGKSSELLKPNDNASRAEAVTFIMRLLKQH